LGKNQDKSGQILGKKQDKSGQILGKNQDKSGQISGKNQCTFSKIRTKSGQSGHMSKKQDKSGQIRTSGHTGKPDLVPVSMYCNVFFYYLCVYLVTNMRQ
jgi:hypothetical protein